MWGSCLKSFFARWIDAISYQCVVHTQVQCDKKRFTRVRSLLCDPPHPKPCLQGIERMELNRVSLPSLRLNTPVCVASRYSESKPTSLSSTHGRHDKCEHGRTGDSCALSMGCLGLNVASVLHTSASSHGKGVSTTMHSASA